MHIMWWLWVCLGLFLLVAEAMAAGGFYLLFIGIAALIVGALSVGSLTAWIQISLFAVLSAVFIGVLRNPLVDRVKKSTRSADKPEFIGETARSVEPIPSGKEGMIELRGSIWQAHNSGTTILQENDSCTIIARENLKMIVTFKQ